VKEAVADAKSKSHKKNSPNRVLTLPDFEHAKTAVLNSLTKCHFDRAALKPAPFVYKTVRKLGIG